MELPALLVVLLCIPAVQPDIHLWDNLNLPPEHIPYQFFRNKHIEEKCVQDPNCPYKEYIGSQQCWGYEKSCKEDIMVPYPECPQECHTAWAPTKQKQREKFWEQGDFGYIKERLHDSRLLCTPDLPEDSSLECSQYTRSCKATNLYMDFRKFSFTAYRERYREDVFPEKGLIGGYCYVNGDLLAAQSEHKSPLQSWFAELQNFSSLEFQPFSDSSKHCDITLTRPTFLIKLDAGVNMYHHFCDFVNLYASQHLYNWFSEDIDIIMWDTSEMHYGDFFHDTWKAFTKHPIISLKSFANKRVCIKSAVFSLLARMRYGLYYNMPLIPGCGGSNLFRAFSRQMAHRLGLVQEGPLEHKLRVTLLERGSKYRNIMNQDELVKALSSVGDYEVRVVQYNRSIPFLEQIQITHNSDIFMGMHGAGLTHVLFQPDWGSLFEIYNCQDIYCYSDLARLRGATYFTWEVMHKLTQEDEGHHPQLGAHAKFTNYAFDVEEFMRKVAEAADAVRKHPDFIKAHQQKYGHERDEL